MDNLNNNEPSGVKKFLHEALFALGAAVFIEVLKKFFT
jgi:hypothetical protein